MSLVKMFAATCVAIACTTTAVVICKADLALAAWVAVGTGLATYGITSVDWVHVGAQREFWAMTGFGAFAALLNLLAPWCYYAVTGNQPGFFAWVFGPAIFLFCVVGGAIACSFFIHTKKEECRCS